MPQAVVRTPDEAFAAIPGFPYESHYVEVGGLRIARVDEGSGPPVVFFHGEPTWSYLWRNVMPPVIDAGFRCIAPDYPGFGRSDKPTDIDWYTYDRHVEYMAALMEALDLRGATAVTHDWGGPIGLRLVVEQPDRFDRVVIMETAPATGTQQMSEDWLRFRDFVERTDDVPVGLLVRRGCFTDPGDDIAAAYDAPFPSAESKAGVRAFPAILPLAPDAPGAEAGQSVAAALRNDDRPGLVLWASDDPILPLSMGERVAGALGYPAPIVIESAGHFLQEDAGERVGGLIADWLTAGVGGPAEG